MKFKLPDTFYRMKSLLVAVMSCHRHGICPKCFNNNWRTLMCRSNTRLHSTVVHGPKLWNSLSEIFKTNWLFG